MLFLQQSRSFYLAQTIRPFASHFRRYTFRFYHHNITSQSKMSKYFVIGETVSASDPYLESNCKFLNFNDIQSLDRFHHAICNFVIHHADRNHSVDRREPGLYNCGIAMVHIRSYRHYIAARIERYRCLFAESHCIYFVHQ